MQSLTQPGNRSYLIAAAGALVALVAFLFLPFAHLEMTMGMSSPTNSTAPQTTTSGIDLQGPILAALNGGVWINVLLIAVILLVVALLIYRRQDPFGIAKMPSEIQARWGQYLLIGLGVVGLIFQFLVPGLTTSGVNTFVDAFKSSLTNLGGLGSLAAGLFSLNSSASLLIGGWIFIVGMLVVIVGGALPLLPRTIVQPNIQPGQYPPAGYPPQQPSGQYPQSPQAEQYGAPTPQYPQQPSGQYPQQPGGQYPQQPGGQYPQYQQPEGQYPPYPQNPQQP
ncbi:DUF3824 domain-containing protein [Ktedonobacter racemifer]|uniref:Uncharacterized protein n=1 Tax=Ktedonobacter racemifer DSM 44963 TaxID=485913 RepID=D6TDT4_KTERA|nr:DUF3824 domain-containing protein [Ktedonobacter racemifer]EFH90216.1 hypothetical protein Krac_11827 [Ktedonobacter racemifer DSM 44963]